MEKLIFHPLDEGFYAAEVPKGLFSERMIVTFGIAKTLKLLSLIHILHKRPKRTAKPFGLSRKSQSLEFLSPGLYVQHQDWRWDLRKVRCAARRTQQGWSSHVGCELQMEYQTYRACGVWNKDWRRWAVYCPPAGKRKTLWVCRDCLLYTSRCVWETATV